MFPRKIDTPFVLIDFAIEGGYLWISVYEPRILRKFYGNMTEPVSKILITVSEINFSWTIKQPEKIDEIPRWMETTFSPKFSEMLEDSFRWNFEYARSDALIPLRIDDFVVSVKSHVNPIPDGRKNRFLIETTVHINITFSPNRPIPKYEAMWMIEKLKFQINWSISPAVEVITNRILMEEGVSLEDFKYNNGSIYHVRLVFGTEQEIYERPMRWNFYLSYKGRSIDSQTFSQILETVERQLKQKPSEGISLLLLVISTLPPSHIINIRDSDDGRKEGDIDLDELIRERGDDLNFIVGTLQELKEFLEEMGL